MLPNDFIKAKKSLGQNFLKNKIFIKQIVEAGEIEATDNIVEIGPGLGDMTNELVYTHAKLLLIEFDKRLFDITVNKFGSIKNITILNQDILKTSVSDYFDKYKVIANIPYYITTPIIEKFIFEEKNKPDLMVLLVQKEYAEKLVAKPPRASSLSNYIQNIADATIITKVPKEAFTPSPKVDSAVIRIIFKKDIDFIKEKTFSKFVHQMFTNPRKKLRNNVLIKTYLSKNNPSEELLALFEKRPEEIKLEEWKTLSDKILNAQQEKS